MSDLKKLNIPLPPLSVQHVIARALTSIDGKIDLLQQKNQTLEAIAATLWRKMFVIDVKPEWKKGKLCEIADVTPRRSLKRGTLSIFLNMANMPVSGPFPAGWIRKPYSGGSRFKNGDTLIARITPCLENGKTAYVNFLKANEVGFGTLEIIVLAPAPLSKFCPEWFYFLARSEGFRDYAIRNMTGASGRQRISVNVVKNYELFIPDVSSVAAFKKYAGPILHHIRLNSFQIRSLNGLRETFLHRIMSGVIRFNNIISPSIALRIYNRALLCSLRNS